ncbi:hypothetical protein Glove_185g21 [Diversispora epigaea]|uniref:BTB domain-containing protein n=1 Tax=Diversispora epigaea TaxID=1348612 RepID=A0A397IS34_9GLOM|nr:hypothetical protein Glove_185g21 [Diversispora epigaea]
MTTQFYDRLSNDLTQLCESGVNHDIVIEVGEVPHANVYQVHSIILQSRCPYFKNKLDEFNFNDDHVKVLRLPDISVKVFNFIIKYIYGGKIILERLESSLIFDLLIVSNELELDELVEHLQTHLINNNPSWFRLNFSQIYQTCYHVKNFKIIQDFCNDIIAKYPDIIFESENFLTLSEGALISILKLDDLQLEEGQIWDYVIRWGRARNPTLPSNPFEWTNEYFLALKKTLKQCLPHIRYFSFPNEDVFKKIFPYQKLLEPKLWLDMNSKIMMPSQPITSIELPPRKILTNRLNKNISSYLSNLITNDHALEISSWIDRNETPYVENNPYDFKLLVRGSRDGFDVNTIYNICDKVSNTVIILKLKDTGEILGGYNPLDWDNNRNKWKRTRDCFVFSLQTSNLRNSILSRVKGSDITIYNYPIYSGFGFGSALRLKGNLKTEKNCYCMISSAYPKPIRSHEFISPAVDRLSDISPEFLFSVEEYEVLEIVLRNNLT